MRRAGSVIASASCSARWSASVRSADDEGFEIVVAVVAAGRRRAAPFGIAERRPRSRPAGCRRRRRRRPCSSASRCDARGALSTASTGRSAQSSAGFSGGRAARLARRSDFGLGFGRALQQRIALELVVHVGGQVQIRQLQQLDGLHQLRRHYERLALTDFESLTERHGSVRKLVRFLLIRFRGRCIPVLAGGLNRPK